MPAVQVASKLELATVRYARRAPVVRAAAHMSARPTPAVPLLAPSPAPAEEPVAVPTPAPAPVASEAPDPTGHELAPGKTVTIIPASAGPSSGGAGGGGDWSEVPVPRGHGGVMIGGGVGGHCGGGRGRGPVSILR